MPTPTPASAHTRFNYGASTGSGSAVDARRDGDRGGERGAQQWTQEERVARLQKDQLESLRRSERLAQEAIATGQESNETLAKQGEQIDAMHRTMDNMEHEVKTSDRLIQSISSWRWMVVNAIRGDPSKKETKPPAKSTAAKAMKTPPPAATGPGTRGGPGKTPPPAARAAPTTEHEQREQDVDKSLDALLASTSVLKSMATDQNQVLREQNDRLDELTQRVDKTDVRLKGQSSRMKRI